MLEALKAEREHLRPLPAVMPEACRTTSRVVDKFAQIVVDGVRYQAPTSCAYKPVIVKLSADRVKIVAGGDVVTAATRSFERGTLVLDAQHVLDLLLHKPPAVPEATALQQWTLPPMFEELDRQLCRVTRKGYQEYVMVLRLDPRARRGSRRHGCPGSAAKRIAALRDRVLVPAPANAHSRAASADRRSSPRHDRRRSTAPRPLRPD